MQKVVFGRTGLEVSRLTFGCGAVGGLMTKGEASDQDRAVAWARDHGVNFFDTAASYGDGASEKNLGRALAGSSEGLVVSTKVGLGSADLDDIPAAVTRSLEASLSRLNLEAVDIFQLHNTIGRTDRGVTMSVSQVLNDVIPAFDKLRQAGKTRFLGFTAKGEPSELNQLVEAGCFDSAQIFFNLLVPSAARAVAADYPADDFQLLLENAKRNGVGSIGVRVLAGGALSGSVTRHPLGAQSVAPIGSNTTYEADVERALMFQPLVEAGAAQSLPELAIRYAVSHDVLCTTEIGIASLEEFQRAVDAVNKGPLTDEVLAQIVAIQNKLT